MEVGSFVRNWSAMRGGEIDCTAQAPLHQYHQVWCFAFRPGSDAGADTNIDNDPLRLLAAERAVLQAWMDAHQGGVFATGDYHCLGASLASRILRIGTMRRWTNSQAVHRSAA